MSDERPPPGPSDRPQPVRAIAGSPPPDHGDGRELPAAPPAEVLETLDTAQQVLAELAARELHFSVCERDGRIRVKVVTSQGAIVREIPTRDAVEIVSGAGLPRLGFDAAG
jgi:hypothetical protein